MVNVVFRGGGALHGWVKILKYINTQEEVTKF